jgi:hypothetical protein
MTTSTGSRNLPAARPAPAPDPVDQAVTLWAAKWGTLDQLPPAELRRVAAILVTSFPDLSPLELTSHFDLLGGKLRPTAEFWLGVAARHPALEWGPTYQELRPGTPAWAEWLDADLDGDTIAAAYVVELKRRDRTRPTVEAGYVVATDPLLYEYTWLNDLPGTTRAEALAAAETRAGGAVVDRVVRGRDGWGARLKVRRPDWRPFAKKKARTVAARRACVRAFSLTEARVLTAMHVAQMVLDAVHHGPAAEVLPIPALPAMLPAAAVRVEPAPPPAVVADPDDGGVLEEVDRRRLFAWAGERDLGTGAPLDALKRVLADALGILVDQVSTRRIRYADLPRIQGALESYPLRDSTHRAVDVVCSSCGVVVRGRPGAGCPQCPEGRLQLLDAVATSSPGASPATPAAASAPIAPPAEARGRPAPATPPTGPVLPFPVGDVPAGVFLEALADGVLVGIRDQLRTRGRHGALVEVIDELLDARRSAAEGDDDGLPF